MDFDLNKLIDSTLVMGILFLVVVFGCLVSLLAWNLLGPEQTITADFNSTLNTEEHLALAYNQNTIASGISVLQEQRLCGTNDFIPDSNRLNEIPSGIIYNCFMALEEAK